MKNLKTAALLLLAAVALAGCGDGFPDEEMHLGLDDKVRPVRRDHRSARGVAGRHRARVTLLRARRAPGRRWTSPGAWPWTSTAACTMSTTSSAISARWPRRRPRSTSDGFLTQTFTWVVPDSALLYASSIPDEIDDPALAELTALLPGLGSGTTLPQDRGRCLAEGARRRTRSVAMDPDPQAATWALADRFVCAVRFRATLRTEVTVDVTRNLTIRQTRRLEGPNANRNTQVSSLRLVALEKHNAPLGDIIDPDVAVTFYDFIDAWGGRVSDHVQVPYHHNWTYYLVTGYRPQAYTSPWDPGFHIVEGATYLWYYFRRDDPTADQPFFVTSDGSDAEMWNLDSSVRLMPAGAGSTYRTVAVVRDIRNEWASFNVAPGLALAEGLITFVEP